MSISVDCSAPTYSFKPVHHRQGELHLYRGYRNVGKLVHIIYDAQFVVRPTLYFKVKVCL